MDLYATGFNAWHQLCLNRQSSKEEEEEPHDLYRFAKVLSAATIKRPVSRLTYTIGIAHIMILPIAVKKHSDFAYTNKKDSFWQFTEMEACSSPA